ncbi:MAG: ORF6N domain-containing protein [bacterium]
MLDKDLAELYGVKTSALKRQVNRNIERFPEDFMFQLTKEELVGVELDIFPTLSQNKVLLCFHLSSIAKGQFK